MPTIYGVGIKDVDYPTAKTKKVGDKRVIVWVCPFYERWKSMLKRCYSKLSPTSSPTYVGCTVVEEWKRFSVFKEWMQQQDWEGKHLDKDILVEGNRVYGPDTCIFVDRAVNNFFSISHSGKRGGHSVGAVWDKGMGKFRAYCKNPFQEGRKSPDKLGVFDTEEGAHLAWKKRKHEFAQKLAELQTDERVAEVLGTRFADERFEQGGQQVES